MNDHITDRHSSPVSLHASCLIVPKHEPIDDDMNTTRKRRSGEPIPFELNTVIPNKRQMATKRYQHGDTMLLKSINGRNVTSDEQYRVNESHLSSNGSKASNQKAVSNGANAEHMSLSSNIGTKPR
jgi:hypothetical protein